MEGNYIGVKILFPKVPQFKDIKEANGYLVTLVNQLQTWENFLSNHTHRGVLNDFKQVSAAALPITVTVTGLTWNSGTSTLTLTSGYVIPTTTEESNWNTAYGWGNHASAGYYKSGDSPSFLGITVGASGQTFLINSHKGVAAYGANIWIGGGGQSSVGTSGNEGSLNVSLGQSALYALTTGYFNVAVGSLALIANTTGFVNCAFGYQALQHNIDGQGNVGVGLGSIGTNVSGSNNVGLGTYALQSVLGNANVGVGAYAGYYAVGSNEFYLNNIDQSNTAGDKAYSLLYGKFAGTGGTVTGNELHLNGKLFISPFTAAGILHASVTTGEITSSKIVNADVDAVALIDISKLSSITQWRVLGNADGSGVVQQMTSGNLKTMCGYYVQGDVPFFGNNIKILEGGATPTKYTGFQGADQTTDLMYTLPAAFPAVSGYVMKCTDAGVMSWAAESVPALTNNHLFAGVSGVATDCDVIGDISASAATTHLTLTIAAQAVGYAKTYLSAPNKAIGRKTAGAGAGEEVNVFDNTVIGAGMSDHITLMPWNYSSVTAGTWGWAGADGNVYAYRVFYNSSNTQNDRIDYMFSCSGGTFTFRLFTVTQNNAAIASVLIDGASVGTIDLYTAGTVYNVNKDLTGISIAAGNHTISLKAATRNGSNNSGWGIIIMGMALWRTA